MKKEKENKNTKILIGAFLILIIAIISFSFSTNEIKINKITNGNIITGFATKTVESECSPDATCPDECKKNNAQCVEESCSIEGYKWYCVCPYDSGGCYDKNYNPIPEGNKRYIGCFKTEKYLQSKLEQQYCYPGEEAQYYREKCSIQGKKYSCSYNVKEVKVKGFNVYCNVANKGVIKCEDNLNEPTCIIEDGIRDYWEKRYTGKVYDVECEDGVTRKYPFGVVGSYDCGISGTGKEPEPIILGVCCTANSDCASGEVCENGMCVAAPTLQCIDSDGGKIYRERGTVSKDNIIEEDVCAIRTGTGGAPSDFTEVSSCSGNNCFLKEYFCGSATTLGSELVGCNDCREGVCYDVRPITAESWCHTCGDGWGWCTKDECHSLGDNCIYHPGFLGIFGNDCVDFSKDVCESKTTRDECIGTSTNIFNTDDYKDECAALTTQTDCENNDICEWFSEAGCFPKTRCIWTHGHCCPDGEIWDEQLGECKPRSGADLCFHFWPRNKEEGKGVKLNEDPKKVCWNIGSMAYGFWVPVETY